MREVTVRWLHIVNSPSSARPSLFSQSTKKLIDMQIDTEDLRGDEDNLKKSPVLAIFQQLNISFMYMFICRRNFCTNLVRNAN